jgi:HigB_toxin, RelE-like toxic component of a toxin-antitoxin system
MCGRFTLARSPEDGARAFGLDAVPNFPPRYNIAPSHPQAAKGRVRLIYRDAEAVGSFTVFNIKGNTYRLIVGIDYENQTIYYKYFLTHAEYDKDKWKNDPYF